MPSPAVDRSKDPQSEFNLGAQRIGVADSLAICVEFKILAIDDFHAALALSSAVYWRMRAESDDVSTVRQIENQAERIFEKAKDLFLELDNTGHTLRSWLSSAPKTPTSQAAQSLQRMRDLGLTFSDSFSNSEKLDLCSMLEVLLVLRESARETTQHAHKLRTEGVEIDGEMHLVERAPGKGRASETVTESICHMYRAFVGPKFTRGFGDDADLDGHRVRIPTNPSSRFMVRCTRLIEPKLSGDQIERMMAEHIKKERAASPE